MIANLETEAKALFLQTRNNTSTLYTELVSAVCSISKDDKQILVLIKKVSSCFDDYWYHLLAKLRKRADKYLNQFDDFIHEAIKRIITSKLEKTDMKIVLHNCDTITVNLQISTILGIVARLPVQDLLKCKTS
ncbi:6246_t:CDS:2 [Dentiscutata heterogama]|uniref:6246_t:CDS:1 n=1 Tax=Dentiscutata heterogama TaxID=1316150 RepID=A0ACA9JXZ6_9GLOM|nr:6246_t:CDS:2 [Dentiscutata heterogama]